MAEVTIHTARFGDINVDESRIITFLSPIFGFDGLTKYVVLDHSDDSPFKWLQSTEDTDLAFVVTNPKFFGIPYEFAISEEVAEQLDIQNSEDALVLNIVNIPQDNPGKMTANLLGPVVMNQNAMKAMQIVLSDSEFSTKTRLIPDDVLEQQPSSSSTGLPSGKGE
jgi:flagellar assembly factor FliW